MNRVSSAAIALFLLGCGDDGVALDDAAVVIDAGPISDAPRNVDGSPPLSFVDFAITGCESAAPADAGPTGGGDAGPAPCIGEVPLELRFTPVAPSAVELYLWTFGDGTESEAASPVHNYQLPGSYDVSLTVGGSGGTATITREGIVQARSAGLGARCTDELQCGVRECVCDPTDGCAAPLQVGLCAAECDVTTPCDDGVCADLAPTDPATPADWQRSLCLPSCQDDDDCSDDLTCQRFAGPDGGAPVRGCFVPGVLGAIGDSCVDAGGAPDDARCATGLCLDEGARGLCSEPCTTGSCPDDTACATFADTDLGSFCLARCEAIDDCGDDPWLACEAPGGPAPRGFTVDELADPDGYCAPRACTEDTECGTEGTCTDGYCGP